jgi:hypothetical protein
MFEIRKTKIVQLVPPQLKAPAGVFVGNTYVDTLGFNHIEFQFITGVMDTAIGSTDATHPLKIEECDTTNGTYTDVTSAAMAAVIAAGDDNKMSVIDIDLAKSHKRYMQVNAPYAGTGTTGSNFAVQAILSRPNVAPATAAQRGLSEWVTA